MSYRVTVYRTDMEPKVMEWRDGTHNPSNDQPLDCGNAYVFNALINQNKGGYITLFSVLPDTDAPVIPSEMTGSVPTWAQTLAGIPEQVHLGEGTHFRSMQPDQNGNPC